MDEAAELHEYLPLCYKTPDEQEYVAFLWDVFETNYASEKYHFAFLAYHMLTMCVVYFNIWQIRRALPDDFSKGLIGFGKDVEERIYKASSPFGFSQVNERTIIRFFRLIGCDHDRVGSYAKLVDARNSAAHSNGQILYKTQAALDIKLGEVLHALEEIEAHSRCVVEQLYVEFMLRSADPEDREYIEDTDQIRELLIHANYFSPRDIAVCLNYDVTSLREQPHYHGIRGLHETLAREYGPDG